MLFRDFVETTKTSPFRARRTATIYQWLIVYNRSANWIMCSIGIGVVPIWRIIWFIVGERGVRVSSANGLIAISGLALYRPFCQSHGLICRGFHRWQLLDQLDRHSWWGHKRWIGQPWSACNKKWIRWPRFGRRSFHNCVSMWQCYWGQSYTARLFYRLQYQSGFSQ